jgi:hypothetical protein
MIATFIGVAITMAIVPTQSKVDANFGRSRNSECAALHPEWRKPVEEPPLGRNTPDLPSGRDVRAPRIFKVQDATSSWNFS